MSRFLLFVLAVLGAPLLAFAVLAPRDAVEAGPAMLVFLLTPSLAGWALSRGLRPAAPQSRRPAVLLAIGLTAAIIAGTTALGFAAGTLVRAGSFDPGGAIAGAATGALTSTLEELGWAAGGIAIARAALGPQRGVVALGLVWAAWHLVVAFAAPGEVARGLFGTSEPLGPARIACFVAGCLAYRQVLTALRDRADSVWPAVAAHATGNVLLGALLGSGWARLAPEGPWALFPGPTGLPFLAGSVAAALWLARNTPPGPHTTA